MCQFIEEFVAHLQAQDASPYTVVAYRQDVSAFLAWLAERTGQQVPLTEVTPLDVQEYRDHLVALGRKPGGVNRRLAALRVFFAWTAGTGRTASNPAAAVKGLRQIRGVPKTLSAEAVDKLQQTAAAWRQLAEARDGMGNITPTVVQARRDEALLNLFLHTGLRVGEAAALRVEDVVLDDRGGEVIVRSERDRKPRVIPLPEEAQRALKAYLEVRPLDRGASLFLGQRGPLKARGIQQRLATLGEAAGVKVTPHMLRHTFAKRLLQEAGADLETVAALLGHTSVATTAVYTKSDDENLLL